MFFDFDFDEKGKNVPGFEQMIKPVLIALDKKGGEASVEELDEIVIEVMELPEKITQIKHKDSGKQSEVSYRIAWARTYLKKYGLIKNERRGIWSFTNKFDGDIDKIDVDEIVSKVRNDSYASKEEKPILTGFESVLAFEKMVGALIMDLVEKEGKDAYYMYSDFVYYDYDILLPEGLEDIEEEIRCVIKYFNETKQNSTEFHNEMIQKFQSFPKGDKYLFVTNIIVPKEIRNECSSDIIIWDKDDLTARIEPEASYAQYLINPKQALIEDTVTTDNSSEQKSNERNRYIKQVKTAFRNGDVVLFLGAGVSKDGGIPLWDTLIKKLYNKNRLNELCTSGW
ncbi:MAG: hypothetical protein HDR27_06220 [Lachnospiraceae bacterium]|nr:hypothetical protein [Lachnospiraceae bacterium]